MAEGRLHEGISLATTSRNYYLRPHRPQPPGDGGVRVPDVKAELFAVDRETHSLSVEEDRGQTDGIPDRDIWGLLGMITLPTGPYLLAIADRRLVGDILGHKVWEATRVELLPFARANAHRDNIVQAEEQALKSMLDSLLRTSGFYYSTTFDLTHSQQRLTSAEPEFWTKPLHARADERFVWNQHLLRPFAALPELVGYMLPVIYGFVSCHPRQSCNGRQFDFALVSRRSIHRAGTRFNRRGIDSLGNVANFIETEQIIATPTAETSLVQTRGSLPIFWSQRADIRYKPKFVVDPYADHASAFRRHFTEQTRHYGPVHAVNLVNQTGGEKVLADAYREYCDAYASDMLHYTAFDFHHECSKMRWDRLSILMDKLATSLTRQRFLLVEEPYSAKPRVVFRQHGVVRTNCVDCLDRTNVVQTMIAQGSLLSQLRCLGVLGSQEVIDLNGEFARVFKETWADHADQCSLQYAGSGALKSDFTRTGKRTLAGVLQDGQKALLRYYRNNFTDGVKQDGVDLLLGQFTVGVDDGTGARPLLGDKRPMYLAMLPTALLFCAAMLVVSIMYMAANRTGLVLSYILFWLVCIGGILWTVVRRGREMANNPRLVPPKDA